MFQIRFAKWHQSQPVEVHADYYKAVGVAATMMALRHREYRVKVETGGMTLTSADGTETLVVEAA